MNGTIQVYVESTKVYVKMFQTYEKVRPECPRSHRGYLFGFPVIKQIHESTWSETHQQAIEVARKVAEEKGMKVKIYNTSSRMGKLRAKLKRVKHTPTIIVGDGRITGNVTKERLLALLKPLCQ
jgi:hypothetical protein